MNVRISIAMCTCNGARFLDAQLESLAAQTFAPFELVVCDDCSDDDTMERLTRFASQASFPVRIFQNPQRLGFIRNFFRAARLCEGDWIAFCDQDDVWFPGKLDAAQKAITQAGDITLVLQNAYICNENLEHDGRVFPNQCSAGFYPAGSQYAFWVWVGFLQTFRANFFREVPGSLPLPRNYYPGHPEISHDKWTCLMANAIGGTLVLAEPAALYRRHEAAVTGSYSAQTVAERIAKSLLVGSAHYSFLSEVAEETATYLRQIISSCNPEWELDLLKSAKAFNCLAQIQHNRSLLYSSVGLPDRLGTYFRILRLGGYFGPKMVAMGWKSAGKDLLAAFGLLRCQTGGDA